MDSRGGRRLNINLNSSKAELMPYVENHKLNRTSKVWSRRGSWEPASTER